MTSQDARLLDAVAEVDATLDRILPMRVPICSQCGKTFDSLPPSICHAYITTVMTPSMRFNALRAMGRE